MRLFKIVFDNPGESYFAGQVVIGKVLIHLNRPKKIKALKLRCVGRAEVSWTERREKASNNYQAKEPYFNFELILLTGEDTSHDIVIPIGENAFPFQVQLPGGIPSSFQGTHGNVQYFLKATLTRPWKFSQKVSSYFTVNGFMDLNVFGTAAHPLTVSKQDDIEVFGTLGCLCCWTSLIGFMLTLDKTGFVPGDNVRFSIQVQNESSYRISAITLTLIQIATFKARRHEKDEAKVVNELHGPGVGARETKVWESNMSESFFKIPAVPPTNLGGGSIIALQYYLSVTLKFSALFDKSIEGRVLLVIGTVPYRNFFEQLMPSSIYTRPCQTVPSLPALPQIVQSQPSSVAPILVAPSSVTLDFTLPPPSYAEAMELYTRYGSTLPSPSAPFAEERRGEDVISINGEDDEAGFGRPFTPRYATYEWNRLNRNP